MKRLQQILILALAIAIGIGTALAGDIQSNGTGGGAWATGATWAGGTAPGAGDNAIIVGNDVVTLGANASITNCTVNSGATLDASTFTLTASGTFTLQANATFKQGGTVTAVPGAVRSFDNASTVIFNGSQNGISSYFTFGNLTWSSSGNGTPSASLTVNGDLSITSGTLRGATTASGTRINTVAGNVVLSGSGKITGNNGGPGYGMWIISGNVTLTGTTTLQTEESSGASGTGSFNINGDLTIGSGCIVRYGSNAACSGYGIINVKGNLTNNGTIQTNQGVGRFCINFVGTSTQTVSGSGTWGSLANLVDTIASGARVVIPTGFTWGGSAIPTIGQFIVMGTLDMQGTSILAGGDTLVVASGATLKVAHVSGLTSTAATGNIQNTGARSYSATGNYVFDGSAAQVTGNQLPSTVNALTLNNSAGVTISQPTVVNGAFETSNGVLSASNLTFNSTAQMNGGAYFDSSPTYGPSSTLVYSTGGTYGRFNEWNATSGPGYPANVRITNSTTLNYPNGSNAAMAISGSLTIDAGSALYMDYGSPGMNNPLTIGGGVTLAGSLSLGDAIGGDLNVAGNWTNNGGSFYANNRAVQFNGGSPQTIGGTTATTFPYLTINNGSGIALGQPTTVANTLNLTSGVITTGGNTLTLNTGGTVNRTSGHIDGFFAKGSGTGNPTLTFEIGTGANYTPVSVAFTGITSAGTLTAKSTSGDHPNVATSGLDAARSVNRYYTLTNSGIAPTNYDVTLNWVGTDTDATASSSAFLVKKYDSGTWTSPSVTNKTTTGITATGLSSFSDFAVGDVALPPTSAPTVNSPIVAGATSVSGTSSEADGTTIEVYVDGSSVGTTTVATGAWTKGGLTALAAGQLVKATATAAGQAVSGFSNIVTVQAVSAAPVVTAPISVGATTVSGTSSEADGTTITVYVDGSSVGTTTVGSGAWSKSGLTALTLGQLVKATATASGKIVSGYSNTVTVTAALSISTASPLPDATAGDAYSQTVAASGGAPPYGNWIVIAGALPAGVTLTPSTGALSGTPTVAGLYNFTVQVKDTDLDSASKAFALTVNPGALHHFVIGTISTPQTAGTGFGIVVTAKDANENTVTAFTGTVGLSTTAGAIAPTTSGNFSAGTRNETVTLTQAGLGKTIGVDDGSGHTATSNTFDVNAGTLHHFAIASVSTPQVAGTAFDIALTAQDLNNNTVTGFTGTVNLTTSAGTITPTTSAPFALGTLTQSVTLNLSGTGRTITADDGSGHTGTSNAFDVNAGALHHFAIAAISSPQMQNTPFSVSITAQDADNNTVTGFGGTVNLSISSGSMTPAVSGNFTTGTISQSVSVSTAGTGLTITADDGSGHSGTSNTFTVSGAQLITSAGNGVWGTPGTWNPAQVPGPLDSVVIRGVDSVWVESAATCGGVLVQSGGKIALGAKLAPTNVVLNGTIIAAVDTLKPTGTMVVNAGGTYQHAQNGGKIPTATWNTGSTLLLTGITGNSPANAKQTFSNIVWNCPGQTASLNLGWNSSTAGVDTTINVAGDISVLSTGTGRWQMSAPPAGSSGAHSVARINIGGNINVSGRSTFTSNGTSNAFTDIIITVSGNVTVSDSLTQFAISRGSQGSTGTTVWNFLGNLTMGPYTATANSNQAGGKWAFVKAGTQTVTLDTLANISGPTSCQFGDGTTATVVDIGSSRFGGSACIHVVKNNAKVIIGNGGYIGGGTSSGSATPPNTASTFTLQAGGTIVVASEGGIQTAGSSGAIRVSGTRSLSTAANYEYNGATSQIAGGALPATVNNLTVNNASGVTLDSLTSLNVTGTLALTNGIFKCAGDTVAAGSVSRTNGYLTGKLKVHIPTGAVSQTFDLGDNTNYTPVSIDFHNVATAGDLMAGVTAADQPNLNTSGIKASKSVNRYWSFTNSGVAFDSCGGTFTFVPADLDAGVNTNILLAEKYDAGVWTPLGVTGRTATTTQVAGVTGFSDFALGESTIHTITASAGTHGTIAPSGAVQVADGGSQLFTFSSDPGYHVDSVIVNGVYIGAPTSYQFNNVLGDSTIRVTFLLNPPNEFSLTVGGANGTVTKNPDLAAYAESTLVQVTAHPNTGYHFVNWSGDLSGSKNPDTVLMTANKSITANFAINTYALTVGTVGSGTVIKNPDQANYNHGTSVQLTASPADGWGFSGWSGDTTSAVNPITIVMNGARSITATFIHLADTICASASAGGSITPNGAVVALAGTNQSFAIAPDAGHHLDSVVVDGAKVDSTVSYTFTNILQNHTIHAFFSIDVYTLTVNTVGNGAVGKSPDLAGYPYGTGVLLTATPQDLSWKFSVWSGDASGSADSLAITMDGNKSITATFVRDSAYLVQYRTFSHSALGFDRDNKGKVNKFVALKPDKDYFDLTLTVDSLNIDGLHVDFGASIDTFMTFQTVPPSTGVSTDGKLKKWDFTFGAPLNTGNTVHILGYGWTSKAMKVSGFWWKRGTIKVGKTLKTYTIATTLCYPMPNRVNALALTLNSALANSFGTSGIIVGRNEKTPSDSSKLYGWFQTTKYTDVLKTLNEKSAGQPISGAARPFDFYTKDSKPMKGQKKSMPPSLERNSLLANMVALKVNIVASDMGILPPGLGDLVYEGDDHEAFNGTSLRQLAALGDSLMMGWLKDSVDARNKPIKLHKFDYSFDFGGLDSVIAMIDSAFEGPLDTAGFVTGLAFKGTKTLFEVPFLRAGSDVVPAKVTPPMATSEVELPQEYRIYQNYPNPFNPTTMIQFELPTASTVTLKVYNILGQEVAMLFDNAQMDEGAQAVSFNARGLASGVYFYRLTAEPLGGDQPEANSGRFTKVMKMMLMK